MYTGIPIIDTLIHLIIITVLAIIGLLWIASP